MFDDEYDHASLSNLFLMQLHVYLDLAMFVILQCIFVAFFVHYFE